METEAPSGRTPKRMVSLRQGDEQAGRINPSSVAAVFTQVGGVVYPFPPACPPLFRYPLVNDMIASFPRVFCQSATPICTAQSVT